MQEQVHHSNDFQTVMQLYSRNDLPGIYAMLQEKEGLGTEKLKAFKRLLLKTACLHNFAPLVEIVYQYNLDSGREILSENKLIEHLELAFQNDSEEVATLLFREANKTRFNFLKDHCFLLQALKKDYKAIIADLLKSITKLDKKYGEGEITLLHIACAYGNITMATGLVELGADPEALDRSGLTPLNYAIIGNSIACIDHLVKIGVNGAALRDLNSYLTRTSRIANNVIGNITTYVMDRTDIDIFDINYHSVINKYMPTIKNNDNSVCYALHNGYINFSNLSFIKKLPYAALTHTKRHLKDLGCIESSSFFKSNRLHRWAVNTGMKMNECIEYAEFRAKNHYINNDFKKLHRLLKLNSIKGTAPKILPEQFQRFKTTHLFYLLFGIQNKQKDSAFARVPSELIHYIAGFIDDINLTSDLHMAKGEYKFWKKELGKSLKHIPLTEPHCSEQTESTETGYRDEVRI